MKMKRLIVAIVCFATLLSMTTVPASAADGSYANSSIDTALTIDAYEQDESAFEVSIPTLKTNNNDETIDLLDSAVVYSERIHEPKDNSSLVLDFSNAIMVTSELLNEVSDTSDISSENMNWGISNSSARDLPENLPPVANPELVVLNPDSLKDGQFTTETIVFIATRWNNVDLVYDPEGGPVTLIANDSFPTGYITPYADPDGTLAGYAIRIRNAGQYPFAFAFVDKFGGASEIFGIDFNILRRGVFETIDGSLISETDKKRYSITVDFSVADEYRIGCIRTGRGGFYVTVYDSAGERVGFSYCEGPGPVQGVGLRIILEKPEGVSGEYTYSVVIDTSTRNYVADDTTFRLAYGVSSQKQYFFEDVTDGMDLPYYHRYRNSNQDLASYKQTNAISDYGYYYKIETIGQETVTLASDKDQHYFKILDSTSFETLFDSRTLNSKQVDGIDGYYTIATINFAAGETYYLVVCDDGSTNYHGSYTITAGDNRTKVGKTSCPFEARSVTAGQAYGVLLDLDAPDDVNVYAWKLAYYPSASGWGTNFAAKSPGTDNWRSFGLADLDFGFENPDMPLVNAKGEWVFRIIPSSSGYYPGGRFDLYYYFDIT